MTRKFLPTFLLLVALVLSCAAQPLSSFNFRNEQRVTIQGYTGEFMEPFLTRDGRFLFFNNSNDAHVNTDLHWAERLDDLTFRYRGELPGVNTPALEAVASMDIHGNFFFVSTRSYAQTASTLYRAHFADGTLSGITLVPGVSLSKPGIVNFDAEISADGDTLYFVESQFSWRGQPKSARILLARRHGDTFVRDPCGEALLKTVNTSTLNYAPATAASECEIFFTRVDRSGPAIYTATRRDRSHPFGPPARVAAITGFAEAPTLCPDEKSLYYHKKENGHLVLYRVTRS